MRRPLQIALILSAWLLASGGQWHFVQGFAWGRMIASYAQTMPLREAVRLTFTPDNMCGVCELVSAAQQQHPGRAALPAGTSLDHKSPLAFQPVPKLFVSAPPAVPWSFEDHALPSAARAAPPLPPPRSSTA